MIMKKIYLAIIIICLLIGIIGCSSVLEINASVNIEEAGEVLGTGQYERDSIVSLKAKPNKGYKFIKWEDDGEVISRENPLIMPLEKRMAIEAVFQKREYTINASSKDPAMGVVVGSGSYKYNESVSLEARSSDGFKFIGWEGIDRKDDKLEFLATKDLRVVAHFIEDNKNLIDREFISPSVSNNNELFAYMFENILSIYSLSNQKALADFTYQSASNEKAEESEYAIKWLEDDNGVLLYYNNELFIQSLNGDKKIISTGNVFNYYIEGESVGFIEYEEQNEEYVAHVKIINLDNMETELSYTFALNDLSQLKDSLLNLERNLLVHSTNNILRIINIEDEEVEEISFKDSLENIEVVNNGVIAVAFNEEIVILSLDNYDLVSTKNQKPSDHYKQSEYQIVKDYMIIKYKQNSQEVYYLLDLKEFESITTQKILNLPEGNLNDLTRVNNSLLLQIDNEVYQVKNDVTEKLIQDDITKVLTLVNENIFYIVNYGSGYYGGLKYKELNKRE